MRDTECPRDRICFLRHCNKVNMIIHKTIGKDIKVMFSAVISYKRKILFPIVVIAEYILTVITPLSDVVRIIGDYNASGSWHIKNIITLLWSSQGKIGVCPYFPIFPIFLFSIFKEFPYLINC